ncbi:CshA/CshB family fibrillar adhesin-related protein [Alcanivorax jadensis]|uniref:CshA/CshB family fibrillar adhesin-related protein n=1 Tax=Alcanivorax jadensis TaxID=64988 RepID=UPI0038B6EAD9
MPDEDVDIDVSTYGSGYLNAWFDWNRDGDFSDPGERAVSNVYIENNGETVSGAGSSNFVTETAIPVSVPSAISDGNSYARFKFTQSPDPGVGNSPDDGEVEDYAITLSSLFCDLPVSTSMQLSGSATRDNGTGEITLTQDLGNQAGSAWSNERISLLSAFTVEFSVYLGTKNAAGADGIAFAFQNDPAGNSATGVFGGALGVGGLNPAVAVEFDTYDNGSGYGDIANDHTAIYNPENYANSSGGGAASLYSSVEDLGNIEDGNWHTVQLNWDPASDQLQYFFDGNLTSTVNVDFVNTVFSGDPNVYFGFTASTGGSSNLQKICVTSAPPQVLVDYGDAPISFGEPSHILGSNLQLGDEVSPDALSYDDEDAAADSFDDGVIFPGALPNLTPIEVSVSGDDGYLQAWVDWNGDGVFDDPQERIATDLQDEDGDGIILVTAAPSGTVVEGDTYARFRWSSVQELDATEGAPDGEVEDYLITSRSVSLCEAGSSASGGGIASGGNGPFRDAIYWLDWNCLGKSVFQTSDVILKSWVYGPVEIRATVSDITSPIEPYVTGSWTGDLLDDLYVGVNPIGLGNVDNTNPSFRIDWEVFLQGDPISAEIIIADAEDTDNGESIISETNGGPWELFAVAPGTNDLQMRFENGGERMLLSSLPGNGVGSFLAMTQGVMTTRHTINTGGGQALAFGVFIQKDHGDIAGGYPESGGHFASRVAQGGGKPTADTDINNISLATLAAPEPYLGVIPPGPEEADQNSANADADGAEEEGVVFSSLVPGSNATLDIIVTETSAGQGYLQGWIDWNRDSDLNDAGEQVALNVRDNGPEDTNPAAGEIRLNVFVPPGAFVGDTYARFRFANAPDVPAGGLLVMGGEVEDYKVTVAPAATAGPLSGWVFEDNGVGAMAHDGQKGPDEPGLANVPVTLYHDVDNNGQCSASDPVLAEATTDGDGAWQLVAALADVGKSACLVVATPNGLLSVSENSGSAGAGINSGAANDDVMSLTVPATGTVWDGILFGDAGLPILEPDQQGVVAPGGSRFYSHRFTARSAGNVDFVLEAPTTSPAAPAWNDALYRDDNCNGELDGADASLPLVGVNVTAGDRLCLLAKVFAPADAPVEALHSRPLSATQTYTGTAFQATAQVTDTTRLAAGQLQLEKQVRNIGPDGIANTGDDVDATDTTANQAAPGDVLRYRLIFRNQGSNPLTEVIVTDSTPAYSALNAAATCPAALPAALSACALSAPDGSNGSGYQGGLQWQFTGELQPGGQGAVSYDVRVSQD